MNRYEVYCRIVEQGLVSLRLAAIIGDKMQCHAEADHLHNMPSVLRDFENNDWHTLYFDVMRAAFIQQSKPEWVPVYAPLWKILDELTEARSGKSATGEREEGPPVQAHLWKAGANKVTKRFYSRYEIYCFLLASGLVKARWEGGHGNVKRCRAEAEHLRTIPDILSNYESEGRHMFYYNTVRPEFIARSSAGISYGYTNAWSQLDEFNNAVRAGRAEADVETKSVVNTDQNTEP